jgi:ketosteroid isomerase-like protein
MGARSHIGVRGRYSRRMPERDLETLRRAFEHFLATGEPLWEVHHEDLEIYDHDIMDGEEYRGRAGYERWLANWGEAWSEFSLQLDEFIDAGERIIVVFDLQATGRGSGVVVRRKDAMVCLMRDGRAARIDYFNSREQALAHAGLGAGAPAGAPSPG